MHLYVGNFSGKTNIFEELIISAFATDGARPHFTGKHVGAVSNDLFARHDISKS
jgi:hypothetical protein